MTYSYKHSHPYQYPNDASYLHLYLEIRGAVNSDLGSHPIFFGLQYYIKKYLSQPITAEMIDEVEEL